MVSLSGGRAVQGVERGSAIGVEPVAPGGGCVGDGVAADPHAAVADATINVSATPAVIRRGPTSSALLSRTVPPPRGHLPASASTNGAIASIERAGTV